MAPKSESPRTPREAAFTGICRMLKDKTYSNLLLDSLLRQLPDKRSRAFASSLFYGVLEREITLQHIIEVYSGRPVPKLDPEVAAALELGLYQLGWMDAVPDSAAVNESVNLVKNSHKKSAAGFVNGILRRFIREGKQLPLPEGPIERASVLYSMPEWILSLWWRDYGEETAVKLAESCLGRPPLQLRVNTLKADAGQVSAELKTAGFYAFPHPVVPDALTAREGSPAGLPAVTEGRCYIQDAASQLAAWAVRPEPGETVFDLCAAPGGKSFTMAQMMEDKGKLLAFDLHPSRVKLIADGAARLGIHCITAAAGDAGVFNSELGLADRVLCDVPCAGLGVIRRKPEIRRKTPEEIAGLPTVQARILDNAARYLKPGGILVYSTCSLNQDENDRVAAAFLESHPDFAPSPLPPVFDGLAGPGSHTVTLSPLMGDFDGFYIARFTKRV